MVALGGKQNILGEQGLQPVLPKETSLQLTIKLLLET